MIGNKQKSLFECEKPAWGSVVLSIDSSSGYYGVLESACLSTARGSRKRERRRNRQEEVEACWNTFLPSLPSRRKTPEEVSGGLKKEKKTLDVLCMERSSACLSIDLATRPTSMHSPLLVIHLPIPYLSAYLALICLCLTYL